ncbi:hypothetical protein C5167_030885 [Papaver somniferum]|uniref:putative uncharacterized protein DDB_G0292636 n=1 Tax=Papaver somniferum TaxID=3469 RepID=UPI000E703E0D|nr:putative uncharacterized protein DDB_G0292636 [Papaver somniferum]RZC89196.1 hypothetical protein C5167_030885 [Papaver somniferum]
MDVVRKDEETVLRKSKKKKHKKNKEKNKKSKEIETLSTLEVSIEDKKKHNNSKEIEAISSSEVPTEKKKKHKRNKEKEALSSSEVPKDVGGEKGSEEKEGGSDYGIEESGKRKKKKDKEIVTECSDVECATDQAASKEKDHIFVSAEDNNEHVKKGKGKKNKRKNEMEVIPEKPALRSLVVRLNLVLVLLRRGTERRKC